MFAAALATALVLLVFPGFALARWSAPQSIAGRGPAAVAVDSKGDAAVVWDTVRNKTTRPRCLHCLATVHVAVRTASGRLIMRTLWARHRVQTPSPIDRPQP